MRWIGRRQSGNVEDRRGLSTGGVVGGGLGTLVILVVAMFLGVDPSALFQDGGPAPDGGGTATRRATDPTEDRVKQFVEVVVADTEDVWNHLLPATTGRSYREPTVVVFSRSTQSGCGFASAATGPFYCPADEKIYLDLQFFEEMANRFRAAGDFAQAYVVAHEVGHHVQKSLGTLNEVHARRGRVSNAEYNRLSVRLELQADFLAGVWAHHAQRTKNILEPGDIEEALTAANAIGDDRLQQQAQGHVVPDSFTHGTSAQRARWFRLGFETGDMARAMDLFKLEYGQL